jgi:type IV secretion system protein VirB4
MAIDRILRGGWNGGSDRHTRRFAPLIGHWTATVCVNQDGALVVVLHLAGHAADLAGARANLAAHLRLNALDRGIADPRIEVWVHLVRRDGQAMSALPDADNWYAARFDAAYRDAQGDNLFCNDLFVTFVMHRAAEFRDAVAGGTSDTPDIADTMIEEFEDQLSRAEAGLARYGARRLGVRERNGVAFSEIAEAFHLIANGTFRPIGLIEGRLGRLILPNRVVFGHRDFHIMGEGAPVFGAIVSILAYPARTSPMMFAALRHVPFPVTITSAQRFHRMAEALGSIGLRVKQMQSGNDAARSQMLELAQDEDDVASGRSVYVTHHFSIAVRAASLEDLDRRVASVLSLLSDAGLTGTRETLALVPAFHGQIPGNRRWWPRPAQIKSINAVAFAPLHDVPRGHYHGRWGAPVVMLRTTADTEYAFHFQVQGSAQIPAEDLGNCLLIGPAGSGKTGLLGGVCLLSLRIRSARVVIVDKDFGLSVMVRAAGGSYLVLPSGSPSGLAPLHGLTSAAEDVAFIERFVRGLILSDGQGELSADEDQRLRRAVARQMEMPPAMRGLAGIAVMLGQRAKDGAAARLRRWCRGERLGWAFDNEQDDLRMDARMIGFDTTALLRDEQVCSPTLSYLFYRTRKLIDGRPIVLAVDEFWQTDRVPSFRDENNDHLKTIRKNEGVVLLATQSARDALNSPNAHTFQQQIPTKIFFGDESARREDLVDGMGLSEAEFLAVTQQLPNMRHTFLMKRPGGSVLCRFDLSGACDKIAVISARRATHELMNRLIARHGPEPEAWVPHFEQLAPGIVDQPTDEGGKEEAAA